MKLVVIDSIAALFRVEYGADQAIQRAQLLRQFGHQLQKMSECHSMAVVCVNQVIKFKVVREGKKLLCEGKKLLCAGKKESRTWLGLNQQPFG